MFRLIKPTIASMIAAVFLFSTSSLFAAKKRKSGEQNDVKIQRVNREFKNRDELIKSLSGARKEIKLNIFNPFTIKFSMKSYRDPFTHWRNTDLLVTKRGESLRTLRKKDFVAIESGGAPTEGRNYEAEAAQLASQLTLNSIIHIGSYRGAIINDIEVVMGETYYLSTGKDKGSARSRKPTKDASKQAPKGKTHTIKVSHNGIDWLRQISGARMIISHIGKDSVSVSFPDIPVEKDSILKMDSKFIINDLTGIITLNQKDKKKK